MKLFLCFSIGVLFAAATCGQAVVEYSVITAGTSAAAAGAKGAGKSIGGVFGSLSGTLEKAGKIEKTSSPSSPGAVSSQRTQAVTARRPAPAIRFVDPSQITEGLSRDELIDRFGEPLLSTTETTTSQLIEKMWYRASPYRQIEIRLVGGKVVLGPMAANR